MSKILIVAAGLLITLLGLGFVLVGYSFDGPRSGHMTASAVAIKNAVMVASFLSTLGPLAVSVHYVLSRAPSAFKSISLGAFFLFLPLPLWLCYELVGRNRYAAGPPPSSLSESGSNQRKAGD